MDRITNIIKSHFDKHRIIFWYDENQEFRFDFDTFDLPDIQRIVIDNNEYGIKYRVLISEPEAKFLLYNAGIKPSIEENWLADILLSNAELKIDQPSLWLSELGLGREFIDIPRQHTEFFTSAKRIEALKKMLSADDTENKIMWKMLAVCAGSDARWDEVIMNLLSECALSKSEKYNLIQKAKLGTFLWEQIKKLLAYESGESSVKDFTYELFKACYQSGFDEKAKLNIEAIYLLKRWKDNIHHKRAFRVLSENCSEWLGIENDLNKRGLKELLDIDYFELIERKILSELTKFINEGTITTGETEVIIRQRMMSHWYDDYSNEYDCLDAAAKFLTLIKTSFYQINSMQDGIRYYTSEWYKIDFFYRKFIYHFSQAKQRTLLNDLYEQIENKYVNEYLLKLNTLWSEQVYHANEWRSTESYPQSSFWKRQITPYLETNKKIFVIISDALRYEIATELMSLIRQEDRYEAELEATLGMIPSYTQLGMAALLPHQLLSISDDVTGNVIVDGMNSSGRENRAKIMDKYLPKRTLIMTVDEVLAKTSDESKKLYREYDVIYIYHNRIDAMGDKLPTETKVFEAVEASLYELIDVVRKLTSGNANNIIITADHGFLYQHSELDTSDFLSEDTISGQVLYKDRRFILGKELKANPSLIHFKSKQLGLDGSIEALIPRGNQRMRLSGSGSRYVHGGASLQEITIPVLKINKKRVSDVDFVTVEIISSSGRIISAGQLVINLYQKEPISDKLQPINLRIGIYNQQDELISEEKNISFNYTSDSPREREITCKLMLSRKAEKANNQDVILRLEKPIPGTNKFQIYKTESYTLRRSFTSDFDF